MNCPKCSAAVSGSDRFCSRCGNPLELIVNNSVDARGGNIEGPVIQAGRDVVYNSETLAPPKASYDAVPKWRSPFTQAVLSWVGVVLGIFGIVPIWKIFEPFLDVFRGKYAVPLVGTYFFLWIVSLVVTVSMFSLVRSLRGLTKREVRRPLGLGWAISGYNHRITLEKIEVSRCPICNGKMKYYMKPIKWIDWIKKNGSRWREITERTSALECKRNSEHWFKVDPAEDKVA